MTKGEKEEDDWEVDIDAIEEMESKRVPLAADIPKDMMCVDCEKNLATIKFSSGGGLEASHFGTLPICEMCYAERNIEHFERELSWVKTRLRREARLAIAAGNFLDLALKSIPHSRKTDDIARARQELGDALDDDWHEDEEAKEEG